MTIGRRMIRFTEEHKERLLKDAAAELAKYGVVTRGATRDETWDNSVPVLRQHGVIAADGAVQSGRSVFLRDDGHGNVEILLVGISPAEEFDSEGKRKASPVTFDRTPDGRIVLSSRWLRARLRDLASNPAAPRAVRQSALEASRRDLHGKALQPEIETYVFELPDEAGVPIVYEALGPMVLEITT